jgi:Restriction endonuclease
VSWRAYQEQAAEFFRKIGCEAEVEATVVGARAQHKIDVWVRFKQFGLETRWVVECKCWNTPVTKEKVLVLKSVVDDVGADRGLLISEAGFQSGAVRASGHSNVTLTALRDFAETAQEELVFALLHGMETRAARLRHALHGLYVTEQTGATSVVARPRRGVDGEAVIRAIGRLAVLGSGFEQVRLNKPPYPVACDDTGWQLVAVASLDEFVSRASDVMRDVEEILKAQPSAESAGPPTAPGG